MENRSSLYNMISKYKEIGLPSTPFAIKGRKNPVPLACRTGGNAMTRRLFLTFSDWNWIAQTITLQIRNGGRRVLMMMYRVKFLQRNQKSKRKGREVQPRAFMTNCPLNVTRITIKACSDGADQLHQSPIQLNVIGSGSDTTPIVCARRY